MLLWEAAKEKRGSERATRRGAGDVPVEKGEEFARTRGTNR